MSTDNEEVDRQAEQIKRKKSFLIAFAVIAVVVICALLGVIIYLLMQQKNSTAPGEEPEVIYNNVVTPDNVDEIISQMEEREKTPVGSYEVSMNTDWVFPDGDSASANAFVENSTANQNMVYFTITLRDSDEELMRSPYLAVGSRLDDIKLDTALEAGIYDSVITYHLVDDEFKELSSVSLYMTITIQS